MRTVRPEPVEGRAAIPHRSWFDRLTTNGYSTGSPRTAIRQAHRERVDVTLLMNCLVINPAGLFTRVTDASGERHGYTREELLLKYHNVLLSSNSRTGCFRLGKLAGSAMRHWKQTAATPVWRFMQNIDILNRHNSFFLQDFFSTS
jgi:hypothetical protein